MRDGQNDNAGGRECSGNSSQDERKPECLISQELFRGGREVAIVHNGQTYRLKITKSGKLILNK